MSDSSSSSEGEEEMGVDVMEEEEEEDVKPEKKKLKAGPSKAKAGTSATPAPTKEDYQGLMAKANLCTNKHKKRLDVARAKKLKQKAKKADQKRKREEAEALGEEAPPKQVPHTLETLREADETTVTGEVYEMLDILHDEFAPYFSREYSPKIVITSSHNPNLKTRLFMKELERVIPNSEVFLRRKSAVKKMLTQATERGFTDVVVINEHQKEPSSLLISHLPTGPTMFFKLSNVKLTKHIKRDWKEITSHRPEVIASNFKTRVGLMVGRMFTALFNQDAQFNGRRVVTFHNQRDYIFFRHHRYEFKKNGEKAALRELGPRFTLKLKSVQKGTFDSKTGEYEWIITNKRHKMEASRRRFHL